MESNNAFGLKSGNDQNQMYYRFPWPQVSSPRFSYPLYTPPIVSDTYVAAGQRQEFIPSPNFISTAPYPISSITSQHPQVFNYTMSSFPSPRPHPCHPPFNFQPLLPFQPYIPPGEELQKMIVQRIEGLFSLNYIFKNTFMLKHILRNKEGFVNLKLINALRKIKKLTEDIRDIVYSLKNKSHHIVLNAENTKIRRKHMPKWHDLPPFETNVLAFYGFLDDSDLIQDIQMCIEYFQPKLMKMFRCGDVLPNELFNFLHQVQFTPIPTFFVVVCDSTQKALSLVSSLQPYSEKMFNKIFLPKVLADSIGKLSISAMSAPDSSVSHISKPRSNSYNVPEAVLGGTSSYQAPPRSRTLSLCTDTKTKVNESLRAASKVSAFQEYPTKSQYAPSSCVASDSFSHVICKLKKLSTASDAARHYPHHNMDFNAHKRLESVNDSLSRLKTKLHQLPYEKKEEPFTRIHSSYYKRNTEPTLRDIISMERSNKARYSLNSNIHRVQLIREPRGPLNALGKGFIWTKYRK